jgi:hypothetical protein
VVLHGTLGAYLREALHEGGALVVARLPTPRAEASFPVLSPMGNSLMVDSAVLFCTYFDI